MTSSGRLILRRPERSGDIAELRKGRRTSCVAQLARDRRSRFTPDMIKIMKGGLARKLFLLHPEIKQKLWGGHLWNPSYCAITVSDRSREQVEQYIESQKEKAWGGRGRPPKDLERLQAYHREVLHEGDIFLQSGDPETS